MIEPIEPYRTLLEVLVVLLLIVVGGGLVALAWSGYKRGDE